MGRGEIGADAFTVMETWRRAETEVLRSRKPAGAQKRLKGFILLTLGSNKVMKGVYQIICVTFECPFDSVLLSA